MALYVYNAQASQVTNRDQFAITSVTIEIMKKSRNPPKFEKERYEAYVYTTSGPENMVMRDRTSNRPFRLRARDEDFATVSMNGFLNLPNYMKVFVRHKLSCRDKLKSRRIYLHLSVN